MAKRQSKLKHVSSQAVPPERAWPSTRQSALHARKLRELGYVRGPVGWVLADQLDLFWLNYFSVVGEELKSEVSVSTEYLEIPDESQPDANLIFSYRPILVVSDEEQAAEIAALINQNCIFFGVYTRENDEPMRQTLAGLFLNRHQLNILRISDPPDAPRRRLTEAPGAVGEIEQSRDALANRLNNACQYLDKHIQQVETYVARALDNEITIADLDQQDKDKIFYSTARLGELNFFISTNIESIFLENNNVIRHKEMDDNHEELKTIFELISKLPKKEVERLRKSLEKKVQKWSGPIPSIAPELYSDRRASESLPEFLRRVYGERGLLDGTLTTAHLDILDRPLADAVRSWVSYHGSLPEDIDLATGTRRKPRSKAGPRR